MTIWTCSGVSYAEEHDVHGPREVGIVRELGDSERDVEVGPMWLIQDRENGALYEAFYEELEPEPVSTLLYWSKRDWTGPEYGSWNHLAG